jgi:hypothetical protein
MMRVPSGRTLLPSAALAQIVLWSVRQGKRALLYVVREVLQSMLNPVLYVGAGHSYMILPETRLHVSTAWATAQRG